MYGIERADRLYGKWLSRSIDDVRTEAQDMPTQCRRVQMSSTVSRCAFVDFVESDGSIQDTVTLYQREIR